MREEKQKQRTLGKNKLSHPSQAKMQTTFSKKKERKRNRLHFKKIDSLN